MESNTQPREPTVVINNNGKKGDKNKNNKDDNINGGCKC
jgi:hypothetical protein